MTDILEWWTLCHWGCLMHCSMFLYPLDASKLSPLPVITTKNISRHCQKSPYGQKSPLIMNHWSEVEKARILTFPAPLQLEITTWHSSANETWEVVYWNFLFSAFQSLVERQKQQQQFCSHEVISVKETTRVREVGPLHLWANASNHLPFQTFPIGVGLINSSCIYAPVEGFYYLQLKTILTVKANKSVWIIS